MVWALSVSCDVRQAESGSHVPETGFRSTWNTEEVMFMEVATAGDIMNLDKVQPVEVGTAVSRASTTDDNAGKSVLVFKFSRKNYESIDIVRYLDQITDVLNSLKEVFTLLSV